MNKYEITQKIETFAPVETAESWDCSGWIVETCKTDVSKIMLCLTPTQDIINQAKENCCDMIISHHPSFYVPKSWSDIDIYCAHTNLDKAIGGTTDTIINLLGLDEYKVNFTHEYIRMVEFPESIRISELTEILKKISPNLRYVNNKHQTKIKRIGFCAGSGSEFIKEAQNNGAECFITGDLKFHTALDSEIVVYDIGHFESEILILTQLEKLISKNIQIIYATEKSPFEYV